MSGKMKVIARPTEYLVCPKDYIDIDERHIPHDVTLVRHGLTVCFMGKGWAICLRDHYRVCWSERRCEWFSSPSASDAVQEYFDDCRYKTAEEAIEIAKRLIKQGEAVHYYDRRGDSPSGEVKFWHPLDLRNLPEE